MADRNTSERVEHLVTDYRAYRDAIESGRKTIAALAASKASTVAELRKMMPVAVVAELLEVTPSAVYAMLNEAPPDADMAGLLSSGEEWRVHPESMPSELVALIARLREKGDQAHRIAEGTLTPAGPNPVGQEMLAEDLLAAAVALEALRR